ncbi:MAG TPA: LLM class flavin-dependent oxidoreductase [Candidatus Binatia bacterium]|jgi:natural product biosynthesis luciferase-like monooxygenase protein|nr:LLM class flavin-dependent oxidoreductase [Candidatus Binatia bacterium]
MRYGIFYLPSLSAADRSGGSGRLRATVEQAAYGEELGFDSVWLAEHHFHSFGGFLSSPPVIGAAMAQRTAKIRIGTAVTLLPYHNPLRVAEDYATLDCLSGGRLEFGIGHGFIKWESLTFGTPLEELRYRFKDSLEIILKAWSEPKFSHRGKFYQYDNVELLPRPVQKPYPTIWMGATSTAESFEFAGRSGFHLMLIPFLHEIDELRQMVELFLSARSAAGHDLKTARVIAMYHVYVGENSNEARSTAEPALAAYHAAAAEARNLTQGIPEPESYRAHDEHRAKMRRLTFNDLVDQNRVLVGDAAEIREKVAHVTERLHLTDMAGNFALGNLPDAPTRATLRRFMEQVAR